MKGVGGEHHAEIDALVPALLGLAEKGLQAEIRNKKKKA
jgi:hypothetical protein